jgi:hypothetical protein
MLPMQRPKIRNVGGTALCATQGAAGQEKTPVSPYRAPLVALNYPDTEPQITC